jgi:hypothetical protein
MGKELNTSEFYDLCNKNFPKWNKVGDDVCFVMLELTKGKFASSYLASEFENMATGDFYYRDWTKSTLPFVDEGEVYWSGFSFQYLADGKKFLDTFPVKGKGNWMDDYLEFNRQCNAKR